MSLSSFFPMSENISMQPEACFLKPKEKAALAAEESHLASERGYVWQPYKCRYDLMDTDSRRTCLKDMNATRFLDFGDRYADCPYLVLRSTSFVGCAALCKRGLNKPYAINVL